MAAEVSKQVASSPANKEGGKKSKEEECVVCNEPATDDVLECIWCEGRQHAKCSKLSPDECSVIHVTAITQYCVFLFLVCICIPFCLEAL